MQSDYSLLITLGTLIVLAPIIKSLSVNLRIPALVGYIAIGFLVSVLDRQWSFLTPASDSVLSFMAQLGIVALLFRVGLRSHARILVEKLPDASPIWIGDVVTNIVLGYAVSRYALGLSLETSLVIAAAFSATSVAVSVAVWDEMGKLNTPRGQLLVDIAELDDLSGVLLLAILMAILPVMQLGGVELIPIAGATLLAVLAKLALFISGCYLFAHYLEAGLTRFARKFEGTPAAITITILGVGLAIASIAGYLGFSLAIGALFAGLAFSRDPEAVHNDTGFTYYYEFLTPFFFIYMGIQIQPEVLPASFGMGVMLLVVAVIGKIMGVALPALFSLCKSDAILLGISMVPRAEIALIIMHQCSQMGNEIIPTNVFSAMVLVSLATSIISPLLIRRMFVWS
jgi:Kef-type K+ transport system membrane component KefB